MDIQKKSPLRGLAESSFSLSNMSFKPSVNKLLTLFYRVLYMLKSYHYKIDKTNYQKIKFVST